MGNFFKDIYGWGENLVKGAGEVFSGAEAARQQTAAQNYATDAQIAEAKKTRKFLSGQYDIARGDIGQYSGMAIDAMSQGMPQSLGALQQAYGQARQDMGGVDTQSAFGANFEQDPGYQFRLAQGQQALDRSRAAAGGRYSGAALKSAMGYNQGMASQEFGAAAQRDAQLRGMQMNQGQNLGSMAMNYGQQQAGMYGQQASNLANLYQGTGTALGNAAMGLGSQSAAQTGGIQQALGNQAQYGGLGAQNQTNAAWQGAGLIASLLGRG